MRWHGMASHVIALHGVIALHTLHTWQYIQYIQDIQYIHTVHVYIYMYIYMYIILYIHIGVPTRTYVHIIYTCILYTRKKEHPNRIFCGSGTNPSRVLIISWLWVHLGSFYSYRYPQILRIFYETNHPAIDGPSWLRKPPYLPNAVARNLCLLGYLGCLRNWSWKTEQEGACKAHHNATGTGHGHGWVTIQPSFVCWFRSSGYSIGLIGIINIDISTISSRKTQVKLEFFSPTYTP